MKINVEIKNLDKLQKKFSQLSKVQLNQAMLKGSYVLQNLSMQNSPVDTGFLRQSHQSKTIENGAEMEISAEYAIYQEMGTIHMSAHPFVRPAIDSGQKEILDAIKAEADNQIKGAI